jgi:lysozyme
MDLAVLKAELTRDEGCELRPYMDSVGKLTVGIGHNLTDKGISAAICEALYLEDVAEVVAELKDHLPWWEGLDPVRQRVFCNMAFNLGIGGLLGFSNTLVLTETGRYEAAAQAMLASKWARQVGDRAKRLAQMMATGQEPTP